MINPTHVFDVILYYNWYTNVALVLLYPPSCMYDFNAVSSADKMDSLIINHTMLWSVLMPF